MLLAILAAAATASTTPPIAPLTHFDPLAKGSVGLEFGFPLGGSMPVGTGSTIGATYLLADNMAVRVDFGLDAILAPSGTPAVFSFGLGLRIYQVRHGPVAIFFFPAFVFGRELFPATSTTAAEYITFAGGVGAEYFFADHFSISGQLGVGLKFGNLGGITGSSVVTQLTTTTSGLFATVYF